MFTSATKHKDLLVLFLLLILIASLGFLSLQNKEVKEELITATGCLQDINERYVRAVGLYDPIRQDHFATYNVPTEVAKETAAQLGECEEDNVTRFLIKESDRTVLTHYTGYVVVGDTDEGFSYYRCFGENECETSAWCEVPQFGPSACTGTECSGDNGFRGCEAEVASALTDASFTKEVRYQCADNKYFSVGFADNDIVRVTLKGMKVSILGLSSVDDEDGTKYENPTDKIALWLRDESAFIEENGTTTYAACRAQG
jgi:membrane-bound inhibitor of C-type lysozyme